MVNATVRHDDTKGDADNDNKNAYIYKQKGKQNLLNIDSYFFKTGKLCVKRF